MAKYRRNLPHMEGSHEGHFLTDAGLETVLIFDMNMDLPEFAAFTLLKTEEGRKTLKKYSTTYINLARKYNMQGFILETPTWRASQAWGDKLRINEEELHTLNTVAVQDCFALREEFEQDNFPIVIDGMVGPRGDGYKIQHKMTEAEAEAYHFVQIETFHTAGVDSVSAMAINYVEEAIGIANACAKLDIPFVIGFTVETDGTLPSGDTLKDAINKVDDASAARPIYYMVICAHYDHFIPVFQNSKDKDWLRRIRGVRANPSRKSHAELDESTTLDEGDPVEYGNMTAKMAKDYPWVKVIGGCCGTSEKHLKEICVSLM